MPVKMIAERRHYHVADNKEYNKGESFTVPDDRAADKLVKMKRAQRASGNELPLRQKEPVMKTRAVTAEPPSQPSVLEQASPESNEPKRYYRRRDLTPEV